ncbi:hypothetical protein GCM10010960_18820 [Arenimonas maotaiensis]|uniref:Cytochrome c n=1 Tax=Arenimonas maotaiensis TaxID=1446479 RepID=A0A917CTL8_9GAMM|nr:hypothetical protein [Arenimonas maotaiensis]GGF97357.1 hypothetical protein GCM10010960_18820 [Arenimonas maotaiensis]
MRFLIALLVGLLAGALLTSILMRSLAAGSAYPKGVMAVQAAHFSALNTLAKDNRCSAAEIQKDLLPMRILAADVEPAFKTLAEQDPQFVRYAADLRRVLDLQLAKGIDNCADLNTGLSSVKQACENCHRDYQ